MVRKKIQVVACLSDIMLLLFLYMLPWHAYEWMQEFGVHQLPEDPTQDVRLVLTGSAVLVVVVLHGFLIARTSLTTVRVANVLVASFIALFWANKFLFFKQRPYGCGSF